ncbi:DUF2975 domain-containing protein [Acidobacteriota bacterium]
MKMLGKRSIASVLKVLLDGLIIIISVGWALGIFFLLLASVSGNTAPHDEFVNLGIPYNLEKFENQKEIQTLDSTFGDMVLGMEISRELTLNLTKWWFLFLIMLFTSLAVVVFVFILLQLRHILASLTEGNPFTLENAKRIRIIGIVIIAGEFLVNLLMIGTALIIDAHVDIEGAKLAVGKLFSGFSLSNIFLGVVVLIIAEIFRLGVRLQEDQELTI